MHRCAACGRYFSGLSVFDDHQDRDYDRTPHVICMDPEELGMRPHKTRKGRNGEPVWSWGGVPKVAQEDTADV